MSKTMRTITVSFLVNTEKGDEDGVVDAVARAVSNAVAPLNASTLPGLMFTPDVVR